MENVRGLSTEEFPEEEIPVVEAAKEHPER